MRRPFAFAVLAIGIVAGLAYSQELEITGETKTVEVERTIVVKEKMKVVFSQPFKLSAPAGAFDYRWRYPPTFVVRDDDTEVLEVSSAPKGVVTITCKVTNVELKDGKIVTSRKTHLLTFAVGEATPPGPPPQPVDAFTKSLQDAYEVETNSEKAKIVAFFASLYRSAAKNDVKDQSLLTMGDLYARLVTARKREYSDDTIILPTRKLIEAELNLLIGIKTTQALDDATRLKAAAAFNRIAASLEVVK